MTESTWPGRSSLVNGFVSTVWVNMSFREKKKDKERERALANLPARIIREAVCNERRGS